MTTFNPARLTLIPFLLVGAAAYAQTAQPTAQPTAVQTQQVAPLKPLPSQQGLPSTPAGAPGVYAPAAPQGRSPGGDIGSGTGDIGKGTAKGVGVAAEGTGKGAVDLVTLHPINAAGNIGKGAVVGGKDVAVGAGKGTGKVVKGVGRGIKHVF